MGRRHNTAHSSSNHRDTYLLILHGLEGTESGLFSSHRREYDVRIADSLSSATVSSKFLLVKV